MLAYFECDIKGEHTQDFMRQYMSSHLSIKTSRHIKMRSTIDNELQYYCCNKCKDSLKILFKPTKKNYILKEYTVNYSECVLKGDEKILNYYLNLMEIYYPTVKQFIKNRSLENLSANKVLKIYSQKVLNSKLTFIDLIDNVSQATKIKISKKWSNMITKYRRQENLKIEHQSKSIQITKQTKEQKIVETQSRFRPEIIHILEQEKIEQSLIQFKQSVLVLEEQKCQIIYAPYQIREEIEHDDLNGIDIDLNGFTSNWEEPQQTLKVKTMNIDQSLPKYLTPKNNSLTMPEVQNPSFESAI